MVPLVSLSLTPDYGDELWALPVHRSVSISPLIRDAYNGYDAWHTAYQGERHRVEQIMEWRLDFKPIL